MAVPTQNYLYLRGRIGFKVRKQYTFTRTCIKILSWLTIFINIEKQKQLNKIFLQLTFTYLRCSFIYCESLIVISLIMKIVFNIRLAFGMFITRQTEHTCAYTCLGKLSGLLGDFDGEPGNDLRLPNGTILDSNTTEETIYRIYNSACKL